MLTSWSTSTMAKTQHATLHSLFRAIRTSSHSNLYPSLYFPPTPTFDPLVNTNQHVTTSHRCRHPLYLLSTAQMIFENSAHGSQTKNPCCPLCNSSKTQPTEEGSIYGHHTTSTASESMPYTLGLEDYKRLPSTHAKTTYFLLQSDAQVAGYYPLHLVLWINVI